MAPVGAQGQVSDFTTPPGGSGVLAFPQCPGLVPGAFDLRHAPDQPVSKAQASRIWNVLYSPPLEQRKAITLAVLD